MWKFKPSKYKNAVPEVRKDQKGYIADISVGTPNSFGNFINASAFFVAFNLDYGCGESLGISQLEDSGSQRGKLKTLNAHSDWITDFQFCPYDDGILATASHDAHVKFWRISYASDANDIEVDLLADLVHDTRVETINFNPCADCIVSTASGNYVRLWDVNENKQLFNIAQDDLVQGISWKSDGSLIVSGTKDKKLSIIDPRLSTNCQKINNGSQFARVLWLGDTNFILTTGFGSGRQREVIVRDLRNFDQPVFAYFGESSLGALLPFFDQDTNMIFLVAKADTAICFWELTEKAPFVLETSKFLGNVQAKGAALVPKRSLKVMEGEVNRLLILGSDCIVPVSYNVPRKSYREFHADLYPNTRAAMPSMNVSEWLQGENIPVSKISLDPSKSNTRQLIHMNHELGSTGLNSKAQEAENFENENFNSVNNSFAEAIATKVESLHPEKPMLSPKPQSPKLISKNQVHNVPTPDNVIKHDSEKSSNVENSDYNDNTAPKPRPSPKPQKPKRSIVRATKFRYLNGVILPKETHITDITALTRTVPGESDGFSVNREFVAFAMGNDGGLIAVLKLADSGRAPSLADVPGVICGTKCTDFAWDPFNSHRLVTACDSGVIQIWDINENSLNEKISEPSFTLKVVSDKASILKFHPTAKDVLCSVGSDLCVHIWDLVDLENKICLSGPKDQILAVAWSPNGEYLAVVSKDQTLRIYNPRLSSLPIKEGTGPEGIRGARIVWVLDGTHIVVSGFNKVSERQVYLYDCNDISKPIGEFGLDVSPATLMPHYDEDSSTLFLTGKGDATVYAFEVATDSPYFHPLSHFKCSGPHQALAFFPKIVCDVRKVEFARGILLTTSSIEPLSFCVPRLRMEYFQDDIFPHTKESWNPSLSCNEWFEGKNKIANYISLWPLDMELLSEAPPPEKTVSETKLPVTIVFKGDVVLESSLAFLQNSKEKEERIKQSMMSKCEFQDSSLPQDSFDGVDPEEWDEEEERHAQQML